MAEDIQRRLAAIVCADVVGYSRLMGVDETGTLAALHAHRVEMIDAKIAEYGGRIVKTMGDGLLLEFLSVVKATQCVIDIQQGMAERNDGIDEDRCITFRIGINLGDIIIEGEDILGDGVNVAARLQELAKPGGVSISNRVHEDVRDRLDAVFEDFGEQTLKNISRPVRVWQWLPAASDGTNPTMSDALLPLPDKPSIAVLPFDNMSGDPEQEYFADGMAEDIITGLSRFRWLLVMARNSSFAFKGKSSDVRVIARNLGVRYVLEGSIRHQGNRIRVAAQLIDAASGNHIWAERYDRDLDDIFAVQDEITEAIITAIEPRISRKEQERAQHKPPTSLDAWGLYHRGLADYYTTTEDGLASAIEVFDRINELEPHFQAAFAMAAESRVRYVMFYRADDRAALLEQARQKAQQGISLDPGDPLCLLADGRVNTLLGQFDLAISQIEEAIVLNPNYAMAHYALGWALFEAGRPEEAISPLDNAIRLSPYDAFLSGFQHIRARALFALQRYQETIEWERRATRSPNAHFWAFVTLAAALIKLDREGEARDVVADLLRKAPHFSISFMKASFKRMDPLDDTELIEAFRRAGVPD